ncbi:hypothetical protein TRIATDRAFT_301410 [Trichoderma atroviride IMI 206040]|uniref:Uncharacterized protein n=1 Tax=Hypocrea atroviridis (strain ATCC 20476 / IMI 206040) TaxID=452589 RepID=G9P627_HYPAI|nr:uncharacterized protein TRIATDRAFT_301410 [Trichoderma atroviride IMI 206040]EHK40580.1 hypothetical protein TRIATDRAFT_301410 [Trichoderma atroviride IMI 206040]
MHRLYLFNKKHNFVKGKTSQNDVFWQLIKRDPAISNASVLGVCHGPYNREDKGRLE